MHLRSTPFVKASYRLNQKELEEIKRKINNFMERGYIQLNKSPYGAPMLFVGKKDGKLRMCIDYQALNKSIIKNSYPLPRIDNLFDRLNGARYFNLINLKSSYYQICITDGDVEKTTMRTYYGSYEFLVMLFGFCNALFTFTTFMNLVFCDKLDELLIIYINDILIYSKLVEEHIEHLKYILQKLKEMIFMIIRQKMNLFKWDGLFETFVVLGGHKTRFEEGPNHQRVAKFSATKGIQSFLRLANFYRKFIMGFLALAKPLINLLKKELPFEWRNEQEKVFGVLKDKLFTSPILRFPNFSKPFKLHTDISGFEIEMC
jgi:hypothetical protein